MAGANHRRGVINLAVAVALDDVYYGPAFTKAASFDAIKSTCFVSHSHIVHVFHPRLSSWAKRCLSRSMFRQNLLAQNFTLLFGMVAFRQPGCRCQKQPWTKTILR